MAKCANCGALTIITTSGHWYSGKVILMSSALLWCFATRHSTQAMAIVLVKCCNAVAEHHSNARRVGLSAPMAALCLLQRTMAIRCEACLALSPDRPTESINTTLPEYQEQEARHPDGHTIAETPRIFQCYIQAAKRAYSNGNSRGNCEGR